jgi:vacuolar-type H+-ATPase subunit I/STV1
MEEQMLHSALHRPRATPAVLGGFLVLLGAASVVARLAGIDLEHAIRAEDWPRFIVLPGLVLLALALVPEAPKGIGFAIAGAVVTTVGTLLFYQSRTGDWESWAYAWALIPTAIGAAMLAYGLSGRAPGLVRAGLWTGGVAAMVFVMLAFVFLSLFAGRETIDLAAWWPVLVIALGGVLLLGSAWRRDRQ